MARIGATIAALGLVGMACALSRSDPLGGQARPTEPAGGGVPISKSTPTAAGQPAMPTEVPPQPTSTPPSGPAPGRAQPQLDGSSVLQIIDVFIIEEVSQLIGIVKNVSDQDIHNLGFDFNFHDASGAIVQTKFGSTLLYTTPAGSINLFEVYFPSGVPANAEAVSIAVDWIEGMPSVVRSRSAVQVEQLTTLAEERDNLYRVTGTIRNTAGKAAEFIALLGIAYGNSGRLIGYSFAVAEDLPAGGTAPFSMGLQLDRLPEAVGQFEVIAEARLED